MKDPVRVVIKKLGCAQLYKMKYLQKFLTSPIDLFKVRLHADITIYHSHNVHTFFLYLRIRTFQGACVNTNLNY